MSTALLASDQTGACALQIPGKTVTHGIVSQALLTAPGLRATLFNFAAGRNSPSTRARRACSCR